MPDSALVETDAPAPATAAAGARALPAQADRPEHLGEALYVLDAEARVRFASSEALRVWRRPADAVLGRSILDLSPTARMGIAGEVQIEALARRQEVHFCVPSALDGHWLEIDAYPTPDGGLTVCCRSVEQRRRAHGESLRTEGALRESESRFRMVAESAPVMLWMGDTEGKCLYLNRALRAFWGVPEDGLQGFDWNHTIHPDDIPALSAEFGRGMGARTGFSVEARYRRADGEYRVLSTQAQPRFGAGGEFLGMIGVNVDVTETRAAEAALRASEQRLRLAQEAGGVGAWEADLPSGRRLWSDFNYRLWGLEPGSPITLERIVSLLHTEDRERALAALDGAARLVGRLPPMEMRIRRADDGAVRWIRSEAEALPGPDGLPIRRIGVMQDVTEQKEAIERLRLLMRELDHRAKNALAVVQSALRLTPRDNPEAFVRNVEGRVAALARAHTLLAEGSWRGARLDAVAAGALAPFLGPEAGAGPAVTIAGPPAELSPGAVQALAMAFHELATNAAKHGALSCKTGRVTITWTVAREGEEPMLDLRWQERGGPPVAVPPARRGFGTSLIEATIRRQLGGQLRADWSPEGLDWQARLPLDRLAAPAAWEAA